MALLPTFKATAASAAGSRCHLLFPLQAFHLSPGAPAPATPVRLHLHVETHKVCVEPASSFPSSSTTSTTADRADCVQEINML